MVEKFAADLSDKAAALAERGDDFAWLAVRRMGEALCELGGARLMAAVYDRALERHGWNALPRVAETWEGIDGWRA